MSRTVRHDEPAGKLAVPLVSYLRSVAYDSLAPYGPVVQTTVRVVTWNVWSRFGPWQQREAGLLAELRRVKPDIIALQEAWKVDDERQGQRFAGELDLHVFEAGDLEWEGLHSGQAVLSRWPIIVDDRLELSGYEDGSGGGAVFVRVDGPRGPIDVVSVILDSGLGLSHVRSRQLADVCEWAKQLSDPFTPLFVCGDFNAPSHSDELRRMVGLGPPHVARMVFYDTFAEAGAGDGATLATRNPFGALLLQGDKRIDHIFSHWPKAHGAGHPVHAELIGDGPHRGVWPSDHIGVMADLRY